MNVLNAIVNLGGKDAEVRYTPSGDAVTQFSVALQSGYGDKQMTTWLNCNMWGKRGETIASYLTKGTRIGITGELTNRKYVDKAGAEKYSLELRVSDVTLLGSKGESGSAQPQDNKPDAQDLSDIESDFPF
ncbi:MAG: single-stranded DNA-binding protein [Pseudomonadota bacterium]